MEGGEVTLNEAIQTISDEIVSILADNKPTIYLCGSVANAIDAAKAAADYLCASNDNDSVAKWSEERILI